VEDRRERSKRLAEAPAQGGRHGRRIAGRVAFSKREPEDGPAHARLVRDSDFRRGGAVEDDRERLKLKLANDEGEDVEGHKLEPTEDEKLKLKLANDEGEDVEGHKL
jgi:hypothetical protein